MPETIYVSLRNEGTAVWAPVEATHIRDDLYKIENCRGEDADLEFTKGMLVRCRPQNLSEGEHLIAYAKADQDNPI